MLGLLHVSHGRNRGFTIIELVVVIVILGILSATALPRFSNLTTSARAAAAKGVAGSLGSAVMIARAQWQALGQPSSVTLDSNAIIMSSAGWPECTTCTQSGVATATKCAEIWNGVMQNPPGVASTSAGCTGSCQYVATGATSLCTYRDQQGTGVNSIVFNINSGAVTSP